eukprot:CAMPEP_0202877600 /NCGR_PEP_ID=MMETSP1391-20130828/30909_1 /ASSEMBLY_ACC=CAM_ASM_000867 /TAXON_ID=1034604 /ORGANISM="Chlamydomonas leiostraca, Strain SAG 11-49" /LENGTH=142 /DNA_ID=CAMNT_0049559661 /DNA_START=483 /DNA_END=911 /DNA_ORIENTATION=-
MQLALLASSPGGFCTPGCNTPVLASQAQPACNCCKREPPGCPWDGELQRGDALPSSSAAHDVHACHPGCLLHSLPPFCNGETSCLVLEQAVIDTPVTQFAGCEPDLVLLTKHLELGLDPQNTGHLSRTAHPVLTPCHPELIA